MLIKNGILDTNKFKEVYSSLDWKQVPRNLSTDHKEYFYVASQEDDEKIVNIQVRPSLRMKVQESFKGFDAKGKKINDGQYNFGSTVEVIISEETLEKIKKIAKPREENKVQKVDI